MKNTPLRQARRQRDLSLYEVAAAVSSTASHLSNIETGKARASAELAARLVWAGILSCEAWTAPFRRGYALWVSGKPSSPGPGSGQHAGRG